MQPIPGTKRLDFDGTWWMYIGPSRYMTTLGRWIKVRITPQGFFFTEQPTQVTLFSYKKSWANDPSQKIEIGI